jgi:hypothetical protein
MLNAGLWRRLDAKMESSLQMRRILWCLLGRWIIVWTHPIIPTLILSQITRLVAGIAPQFKKNGDLPSNDFHRDTTRT